MMLYPVNCSWNCLLLVALRVTSNQSKENIVYTTTTTNITNKLTCCSLSAQGYILAAYAPPPNSVPRQADNVSGKLWHPTPTLNSTHTADSSSPNGLHRFVFPSSPHSPHTCQIIVFSMTAACFHNAPEKESGSSLEYGAAAGNRRLIWECFFSLQFFSTSHFFPMCVCVYMWFSFF